LTLRTEAEMVFAADNVLVGFPGGRLSAVALSNGAARWEAGVSEPKGATEVERLADVLGLPVLTDDEVCAASYQGRIACFEARSGDLRWAREFNAGAGASGNDKLLVGVNEQSHVSAFSRTGGAGLWQNAALANRRLSTPVVIADWVLVGDLDGYLHAMRLEDGRLVGRLDLGEGPLISAPQLVNGRVLLQTSKGRVCLVSVSRSSAGRG
jgi:outer membrane protein assembly factor BamB